MAHGVNRKALIALLFLAGFASRLDLGKSFQEEKAQKNPFEGDPKGIEQGMNLYRFRCAVCHGIDGRGERATDLTEILREKSDSKIFRVIERGIPGTEMPAAPLFGDEIWMVVSYLRTLGGTAAGTDAGGDPERGKKVFWGKGGCNVCHWIDGEGGRLGPN